MGTKNNPGEYDCYAKAEPDEPIFVLLGRDPLAPELVRMWAEERQGMIDRGEKPASDAAKIEEAEALAAEMEAWWRKREEARGNPGSPLGGGVARSDED